jgi:hypothetical protein
MIQNDVAAGLRPPEGDVGPDDPFDDERDDSDDEEPRNGSCLAPGYCRQLKVIGPSRDRRWCWGCISARLDSTSVPFKKYNEMAKFFKEQFGRMDPLDLAKQLWVFFELYIRMPANQYAIKHGLVPLEPWLPVDILDHFTVHMNEPSAWLCETIDQMRDAQRQNYRYSLFEKVKNKRGKWVRKVNDRAWKRHKEIISTIRQLYNCRPSGMLMYNPGLTINWNEGRPFTNMQKPMNQTNVPAVFTNR